MTLPYDENDEGTCGDCFFDKGIITQLTKDNAWSCWTCKSCAKELGLYEE